MAPSSRRSLGLQSKAAQLIPGSSQLLSKRSDQFSKGVWPGYFEKAKGCQVWDLDGNPYLDMSLSGVGANILGYADDDVDQAVIKTIRSGTSSTLNGPEEVELAEKLCEIHPWAERVRYTRTGGEAVAVAVRIARAATGRDKIAFCGYHGWHDWYLAANVGDDDALRDHLLPGLNSHGVPKALKGTVLPFHYNRIDQLAFLLKNHSDEVAGIVMEPLRNDEPKQGFLEEVRRLADQHGAALIIDEISAGFRLGPGGAHLAYDLRPDIAVFSKALGNGYPIAAIIGNADVMEGAQKSFISSTAWSERVGPTAALATIEKMHKFKLWQHLDERGRTIKEIWQQAADSAGIAIKVSGMNPMAHFTFEGHDGLSQKALFIQEMLDNGILASNSFYAMGAHSEKECEQYRAAAHKAFQRIAAVTQQGELNSALRGQPANPFFQRLN